VHLEIAYLNINVPVLNFDWISHAPCNVADMNTCDHTSVSINYQVILYFIKLLGNHKWPTVD